jgi:hypothetical protein
MDVWDFIWLLIQEEQSKCEGEGKNPPAEFDMDSEDYEYEP